MFFSVVIPTFNRAETLRRVLEAFYKQSVDVRDYEIIVVNDGGSDNTARIVGEFKRRYKNIRYVRQKNSGQGVARNKGIALARGKVIVLGQDDIIPTHDFLYEHQKFHYLYPGENDAVLGFTAWHPELVMNDYMKWVVNGSSILGKFGGQQFAYEKLHGKSTADYNFFYTSNISVKTSLFKKFPFDPDFSGYGWEDIELGYRMYKEAGLKLHYNSWAVAYHFHQMDETSLPARMESVGRSAWIMQQKAPELAKVPGVFKFMALKMISSWPVVAVLRLVKSISRGKYHGLYYYALSKKYFLRGLKGGRKNLANLL